ncbi:glycoside hydrolase family 32 protein [Panacibacter ginsenosidivorans]|uniref:Glycoside hydrolase family 32 protein n=1 Tax=Panacibacter ginsenosidivorans TaxID=1813871 RepID=A0A5B8V715_9BACT|nr:glycoside hydrolase family 32 protein [Panacibacter ginsenosidivorans]QEC67290.1 glycoside hydrolase family 32 protein [Panacibacter ginsenosidivorans]
MRQFFYLLVVTNGLFLASCNNNMADKKAGSEDTTFSYRPLYHFTTDSNWINDPNGLVYANGQYHLFAQYNPYGDKWGHMSWAHAVSKDLFEWNQWPLAIPEIKNNDSTTIMIFSGSAVVDSFNTSGFGKDGQIPLVAIYTSHVDKNGKGLAQHESLAYSVDEGKTWQQYANNPVLDIHLTDFRDPKVFWYAPEKKWIMAVVRSLEYKVQFYASADLKKWNLLSEFGGVGNVDKIWECPDLFPITVEGSNEQKWVLSLSAGHPQKGFIAVQYFTGNFDGKKFTADKLDYPLYIDYGKDFYAGVTYNNIPASDGRRIMIGWANCWNYANDIPTKGFRGAYSVPRSLTLKQTAEGLRLFQLPAAELNNYEQDLYSETSVELNNTSKSLDSVKGTALDISFELKADAGATAGINVFKSGDEETTIAYTAATKTISLDRTKSGDTSFHKDFSSVETVHLNNADEKIKLRILIDKSMVEVFVNDGLYAITDLVFPKHSDGGIELFAKNGTAVFMNLDIKNVAKTIH